MASAERIESANRKVEQLELSQEFYKSLGWMALESIYQAQAVRNKGDVPTPDVFLDPASSGRIYIDRGGRNIANPIESTLPEAKQDVAPISKMGDSHLLVDYYKAQHAASPGNTTKKPAEKKHIHADRDSSINIGYGSVSLAPQSFTERRAEIRLVRRLHELHELRKEQTDRVAVNGRAVRQAPLMARIEQLKNFVNDRLAYKTNSIGGSEYVKNRIAGKQPLLAKTTTAYAVEVSTPYGPAYVGHHIDNALNTDTTHTAVSADIRKLMKSSYEDVMSAKKFEKREKKLKKARQKRDDLI